MCGIAGFVDFTGKLSNEQLVLMTDSMTHRGPDDSGYSTRVVGEALVGLGHRRLAIIDLTPSGHQPMVYEQLEIVFNGEIYNYKEIRLQLEEAGYQFTTGSDTEVILKAFHCWGHSAVDRFIGMFAFALLDNSREKLFLYRDRAGVKPLYYHVNSSGLLFGSELKAMYAVKDFKKDINTNSLTQYFIYGYILAPHTIFNDTYKIKPGHYLEYDFRSRSVVVHQYWNISNYFSKPKLKISENDAIEETEKLLKSAFEYRMVADVPVGVFLSGGYDSTTVAAILQNQRTDKLKTFTIGFKIPGFNEAEAAKETANYLGTDHHEYYCTEKEAKEILEVLPYYYDEPFGDSSAIPTILVSRIAKKNVTVALSADGGDELFGGYNKHASALGALRRLNWIPRLLRPGIGKTIDFLEIQNLPFLKTINRFNHFSKSVCDLLVEGVYPEQVLNYASHHINRRELNKLFRQKTGNNDSYFSHSKETEWSDPLDSILATDYRTYMVDDILTKVDRATMSTSLEGREPFLDHRIAEFVAQLPSSLKIKNGSKKYLLKQITHKYVPKEMMDRPKAGFRIPVEHWFRKDMKPLFSHYLNEERIHKQGLFNWNILDNIIRKYQGGSDEDFEFLWSMLVFQMWCDRWMN
jgi:asparagine synthase (glutamine-hydrolysing)